MAAIMPKKPTEDPRKFGLDESRYQGFTDYAKMKVADDPVDVPDIEFCGVCTGISWAFQDGKFPHHWKSLRDNGTKRFPYHVLYPDQPVLGQIENMLRVLGNDLGEGPPVIDVELDRGQTKSKITQAAEQSVMITKQETGRQPMIYTRPLWVRDFMLVGVEWYKSVIWWMAGYLDSGQEMSDAGLVGLMVATKTGIPVENVWFHQTSDDGNGPYFGAESAGLDYDRFRGTSEQWASLWSIAPPPPPPPPPGPGIPVPVQVTVPAGKASVTVVEV